MSTVQKHSLSYTIVYKQTQFSEVIQQNSYQNAIQVEESTPQKPSHAILHKLYVPQEKSDRILPKLCNIQKLEIAQMSINRKEVKSSICTKHSLQLLTR